jgi:two-component system alkaline phosphatase synthesis response regulator PhoP
MAHERIMVVDDEEDILELVRYNLERDGFRVRCVATGEDALTELRKDSPDLIILDLMLPGVDGLEVCKILKKDEGLATIPVLMLTAKGEEADVVTGLELGADDYVTKPFSPRVLSARVKAVLRRKQRQSIGEEDVIEMGKLLIHPGRHEVSIDGSPRSLTATEFHIIHYLARRPGWVFTRQQIIEASRGYGYPVTDRSVDVHIAGLRKKLGSFSKLVETVRGVGYRFREPR